ncbi:MAG: flagellar hook-length control protein FliK [Proteobacteria bacterium]|nr:flagellar hook-length control protein FliK [Pseudomonadota bacterium]
MSILDVVVPGIDQAAADPSAATGVSAVAQPSEADAALFLALLRGPVTAPPPAELSAEPSLGRKTPAFLELVATRPERIGNSLPDSIFEAGSAVPESGGTLPDDKLEDFAVDLGIDRDLARLLLSQTTPVPIDSATVVPTAPVALTAVSQSVAAPVRPAIDQTTTAITSTSQALASWFKSTDYAPLPPAAAQTPVTATDSSEPWTQALQVSAPAADQTPFSAQHLQRFAALGAVQVSIAPAMQQQALATQHVPVGSDLPDAATLIAQLSNQAPLADEDVLRWRATASRGVSGSAAKPADSAIHEDALLALQPSDRIEQQWNPVLSKSRLYSASRDAAAPTTAEQMSAIQSIQPIDVEALGNSAAAAPMQTTLAAVDQPNALIRGREAQPVAQSSAPVTVPSSDLSYEDRAAAFSDQVGRKIIESIRTDRWEVNIKLDPEHLGPLDIRLYVDGKNVNATLDVHSAEVQNLLQQGLSKLKDQFESSGYALTAWSFGSSGTGNGAASRRESSPAFTPAAASSAARSVGNSVTEAVAPLLRAAPSDNAIDLFV